MSATGIDPVRLTIVQKQLDNVAMQMGLIMTRTARSPMLNQSHDFTCFIASASGDVLSQADGIPIHSGGGGFALQAVIRDFGEDIGAGDAFILNDPYAAGNNHLPDWTIVRPVFVADRLCGFVCNRAHQSDIGGGAAGTYNPLATEIFHEGIRLPVLKLVEAGSMRKDLHALLLLNSRSPDLIEGDLSAMLGSTRIGAERIATLIADLGIEPALACFDALLAYGDRRMRAAIAALPDGTYTGSDGSDTDCFRRVDVPVNVSITVAGDTLSFDFTGSSPQIAGFKNSSIANTHAAVYLSVATFFEHDLPRNTGVFRPITIMAPAGTVVNAISPAPSTMNTIYPAADIIAACWKALARASPERACAGWAKTCHGVSTGYTAEGKFFVLYHWLGSAGAGAVKGRDGFNSIGMLGTLGGLTLPNVEGQELAYPVRVMRQEFRRDTAGAGEFRGGCGVEYECQLHVPTAHATRSESTTRETGFGVNGGGSGARGVIRVADTNAQWQEPPQYGVERLGPACVMIQSSAGGGWGRPIDRNPESVRADVLDEILSEEVARRVYGVVLLEAGEVDRNETDRLRHAMRRDASH